jgi:hypothetical protein
MLRVLSSFQRALQALEGCCSNEYRLISGWIYLMLGAGRFEGFWKLLGAIIKVLAGTTFSKN